MNFSIRKATEIDINSIAEVKVACWRSTYKNIIDQNYLDCLTVDESAENSLKRFFEKDTVLHVVETRRNLVVGYCSGGIKHGDTRDYDAEIYAIYILDEYQNNGLGKKLIHSVVYELYMKKHKSIITWCLKGNPYKSFYENLGGELVRESKFEIGGNEYETLGYAWKDIRELLEATANVNRK